jgi:hypothetical protein
MVLSGYPALDEALSAIRLEANENLVKPIQIASLRQAIHTRLSKAAVRAPVPTESVAAILEHNLDAAIHDWTELVEQDES